MADLATTVRQFCREHGLKLSKDLGQHFLIDQEVLDSIITAADIQPDDHIVEIGPGIGVLTKELLKKTPSVTTIELDDRLPSLLKEYISNSQFSILNFQFINGNALKTPMPNTPYKIVANIPYHITSPLLRHVFLESQTKPTSMTLLIQREVAEKICDTKKAGLLTVLVGLFGTPKIITTVPPKSFLPPPKVDSAVLHVDCFSKPIADHETIEKIFSLTKIAFGQKRKMLSNTIGSTEEGRALLEKANVSPKRRPETLSIAEWISFGEKWTKK